jgi:XisH protein
MTSLWLISGWAVELQGEVYCSVLMAARDIFHLQVRSALEKEGWVITDDPLKVEMPGTYTKSSN